MNWMDIAQLVSGLAMAGLIWTVQLVVYPAFLHITPAQFTAAHAAHTRRISFIVGPLLLLEWAATIGWLLSSGVQRAAWQWGVVGCVATAFLSTALLQVPLHRRLSRGWNERLVHRLIHSNWIRTLAWTLKAMLVATNLHAR